MRAATARNATASRETPATVRDVISAKMALIELLVEETSYMNTMQIRKVADLQERKLKLTSLLERYTRYLHNHPEVMAQVTPQDKGELEKISQRFHQVMKINYETLLVARAVNNSIVKCVTQATIKKGHNSTYNAHGAIGNSGRHMPISVTLNQTI